MISVTCPDCGQQAEFDTIRRGADEFCPKCDYPLFWVRTDLPTESDGEDAEATRRRLPGTGGRLTIGSRACPECNELNRLSATHCVRCGSLMDPPPPEPEPEPEPEPVVEVPPPPPPPPPPPTWPLWAAVAGGLVAWVVFLLITN